MIDKTINYIWLSDNPYSSLIKRCIKSWKKYLPDYTLIKWDVERVTSLSSENNIDNPLSVAFVSEAIEAEKWAFASDYLRQWIIYNFGGFYFDTDIAVNERMHQRLEDARRFDFASCIEFHKDEYLRIRKQREQDPNAEPIKHVPGFCIQAALFGGKPHNSLSRTILDYYHTQHYVLEDGSYNEIMVAPDIYALQAKQFGFRYITEEQKFYNGNEKYIIYDKDFCSPSISYANENNCAFHLCEHSWKNVSTQEKKWKNKNLRKTYRKHKGLCKIF